MHVALLSRYTTLAVPLWLAVGPLVAIAIASVPQRAVRLGLTCVAGAVLALAVYEGASTWERGNERMAARASIARRAAACIAAPRMAPDVCYRAVCWDAAYARQGALQLKSRGLGPWRGRGTRQSTGDAVEIDPAALNNLAVHTRSRPSRLCAAMKMP
mgnify:CR=1 FL=1